MGALDIEIQNLEKEIAELKSQLLLKEEKLQEIRQEKEEKECKYSNGFTTDEIVRYSRQMLVPQFGTDGQLQLKKAKVLVVGTGGLGCPCLLYLVSAGIGEIMFVDNDEVEISNLHRQVLHNEANIGVPKVLSAFQKLKRINSNIKLIPKQMHANSSTISSLFKEHRFDVVVDGTDNVATRYLLNDACVINKVPLVSGSALQLEGQLTVYNHKGGPCYRCLFPTPPPPETVTSCGDGGVLGPVPGMIGVLQALEVLKILSNQEGVLYGRLLVFDGAETKFRNIQLRPRNQHCAVCGNNPVVTSLIDYEQFCGAKADDKVHNISILEPEEHVSSTEIIDKPAIIDVRPEIEFNMCHLPKSINISYNRILNEKNWDKITSQLSNINEDKVYVICRRGNDSQRAISLLKEKFDFPFNFVNVKGGFHSYSKLVDRNFPIY